jgi:hypothetical protein
MRGDWKCYRDGALIDRNHRHRTITPIPIDGVDLGPFLPSYNCLYTIKSSTRDNLNEEEIGTLFYSMVTTIFTMTNP